MTSGAACAAGVSAVAVPVAAAVTVGGAAGAGVVVVAGVGTAVAVGAGVIDAGAGAAALGVEAGAGAGTGAGAGAGGTGTPVGAGGRGAPAGAVGAALGMGIAARGLFIVMVMGLPLAVLNGVLTLVVLLLGIQKEERVVVANVWVANGSGVSSSCICSRRGIWILWWSHVEGGSRVGSRRGVAVGGRLLALSIRR